MEKKEGNKSLYTIEYYILQFVTETGNVIKKNIGNDYNVISLENMLKNVKELYKIN